MRFLYAPCIFVPISALFVIGIDLVRYIKVLRWHREFLPYYYIFRQKDSTTFAVFLSFGIMLDF